LANVALDDLARHLELHGTGQDGLVLHEQGRPMSRQRFGQVWRVLRNRAELPQARFHDARHTYASILLAGGVSVPAAADCLGHTTAILLNTYAHLMPEDHDRARSAVQSAFEQEPQSQTGAIGNELRTN
jgi:integrase